MQQILKRLELIKTSIAIEDEEIIELQITKLSSMSIDADVQNILLKLSNSDYGNAVVDIETYIARYSGLVVYEDKELAGLKLELKVLEAKLQNLSEEKNEYLNEINEFNILYNLRLGEIIRNILDLKKKILYKKTIQKNKKLKDAKETYEQTQSEIEEIKNTLKDLKQRLENTDILDEEYDEILEELSRVQEEYEAREEELNEYKDNVDELEEDLENDPDYQEYQESKEDYENFNNEYEEIVKEDRFELSEDEKKELKQLYRKASKLCHPDIVPNELKEQAMRLMQQLNEAYSKKDLTGIQKILFSLESGNGFVVASDSINDKELLKLKISEIREKIDETLSELAEITATDTFSILAENEDLENYFEGIKHALEEEQTRLVEEEKNTDIEPKEKIKQDEYKNKADDYEDFWETVENEEDNYWNEKF